LPYGSTGSTLTTGDALGHTFWSSYRGTSSNKVYDLHILIKLILYAIRRRVAEDVQTLHIARSLFMEFMMQMEVLLGMKDFVEKFGARTPSIDGLIGEVNELNKKAGSTYVEQVFEGYHDMMTRASQLFREAELVTVRLKQRALFGVYMTEWMATAACCCS